MCLNVAIIVTIYHNFYEIASILCDKKEHFTCDNRLLFRYELTNLVIQFNITFLKQYKSVQSLLAELVLAFR